MQDLPRKILYMSVMVMVCLPEALTGFWSKSARGNSDSDVCRQYQASDDVYGRSWYCICVYALLCYLAESIQEAGIVDRLNLKVGIHGAEPWTEEMRKKD